MKKLSKVSVFLVATITALMAHGSDNGNAGREEGSSCVASFENDTERYAMRESISHINGARFLTAESHDYRNGVGARVVMGNWGPNYVAVSVTLKKPRIANYDNGAGVGNILLIDETYWNYTVPSNRFPHELRAPRGDKVGEIQCDRNASRAQQ